MSKGGWTQERAANLLELLQEDFSDVRLIAKGEEVPASRLLLAAACPGLKPQLSPSGSVALHWPEVSPKVAKAIVEFSCGVASPFAKLSAEDVQLAQGFLRTGVMGRQNGTKNGGHGRAASAGLRWYMSSVLLLGICVATLTAYWPVRDFNMEIGGFFMDDAMIRRNAVVVDTVFDIARLWRTDYWGLEMFDPNTWTHKSFRPLTVLTFRWNYLCHGFGSSGFHMTNAVMHGLCSLHLGFFALRVLQLSIWWAGLLAALFMVHPVHTESICYVVGRADILCAQVLLIAMHFYSPALSSKSFSPASLLRVMITCALVVASGLCKETGFTFFGLLVIWEILTLTRNAAVSKCLLWLRVLLLLVAGVTACGLRVWYTSGTQIARMDPYSNPIAVVEDPYVRALSYALVHGMYIKLLLWPVFLCYDYSMDAVPLVESLVDSRLLLPLFAYLGFVLCSCHSLKRLRMAKGAVAAGRAQGAILGLAIFLLSFLPMTNILFPIGTLVAERLLYLPSMGFLLLFICFLGDAASEGSHGFPMRARQTVVWLAAISLLGFWWYLCHLRVDDWESVEQITLVDGLKQLRSSRTQFNLANLYLQSQRMDEALLAYRRSIAADPQERDAQPLYHAGQILMYRGQYEEAEVYLHKAVTGYFSPLTLHEEEVWHDYGLVLWHVGRHMEAAHNFQNAIITNPTFPKGHNNLACALVMLGLSSQPMNTPLVQQGLQAAEQAITLAPHVPLYWRNAAVLLSLAGDQSALAAWERFRQYDPKTAAMEEANGIPRDCTWEFYFR